MLRYMLHLQRKKAGKLRAERFLLFGLLCCAQVTSAQFYNQYNTDLNLYDHDSKPYYFGITLGGSFARFHTELHDRFLQYDSVYIAEPVNSGAFSLGLMATARLTNRFHLRFNPQLSFMERNIFYKLKFPNLDGQTELTQKVESVIVTFPLNIKFQSDRIGNFRVYMLTGVYSSFDLASNASSRRAEDLIKIQKNDYGYELGIGFNFFFPSFIFSPEIKINNGLRNIHSRDANLIYSNVLDRIQSRLIVFSIHLEG
jgi:hypothetical protein